MAATPPRPASPTQCPVVVPKTGHALQISPNLEALLEHDELTRRNSNSPTSAYYNVPSPGFPISLPPPPPRKAKGGSRAAQDAAPASRSKEAQGQRRKSAVVGSDQWPDALPATFPPDGCTTGQSASASCDSRPATPSPNPYLNPTPVLRAPHQDVDDFPTPKQADKALPPVPRVASETRGRAGPSDPSHRLNKVEKILWMGRDSLSLFSGAANGARRHSDGGDAVQGDVDTATVLSSGSATPYLLPRQQLTYAEPSETASVCPSPTAAPLSHTSMTHTLPSRPQPADGVAGDDYLSFIDFFSPSTSDDCNMQENSSPRRRLQSITIPPSSLYSNPCRNLSTSTLASMRFAPPSPTSVAPPQLSPAFSRSDTCSSSVTLASMRFAPPSPASERAPTCLQPLSGPPSPYSPLEFAPPPGSPQEILGESGAVGIAPELERGRKPKPKKRSKSSSPHVHHFSRLPPTTNELCANERADRIRRNRKLARVFGRTPGTEPSAVEPEEPRSSRKMHPPSLAALLTKQKNHRHAVSVSVSLKTSGVKTEPSTPWQNELWSPDGRRYSTPLATRFTLYVDDEQEAPSSSGHVDSPETASTRSFIDLSDEETRDDDMSGLSFLAPQRNRHRRLHHSTSTPSFVESLDPETQAEQERRRKREKLVRLHRFLGSRVPPEAIIGSLCGPPLPPTEDKHDYWPRDTSLDEFDRGKEELDDKEKALNVRRAQKMEKVFGTPPPQTLFHTRPARPTVPVSQPTSPNTNYNPYVLTLDLPSSSRNPNQSAYMGKAPHRPGPSESSRCLLPHGEETPQSSPSSFAQSFADSFTGSLSGYQQVLAQSSVYLNYQHSLNSLIDIIDRDDRQSLVELHRFLHGEVGESPSEEQAPMNPRRASIAASLKSERRHSLPSTASISSLSSEFLASPKTSLFQIRRRKAAKLTNFFGVDYRELIHDILESIEKGVEEERKQGTLQPQEVEVLMHRVQSLRSMKDSFPC